MPRTAVISLLAAMLWWGGGFVVRAGPEPVWRQELTPLFPIVSTTAVKPPPLAGTAHYRFGWMKWSAATAKLTFNPQAAPNEARIELTASTIGPVRNLWRLDASAYAVADAARLLPLRSRQVEYYKRRTVISATEFLPGKVLHGKGRIAGPLPAGFYDDRALSREEIASCVGGKVRRLKFDDLLDMHTALLRTRLHPLNAGDRLCYVVYHDAYPYLARVEVVGRETLRLRNGTLHPAIRLRLDLQWIDRDGCLQEHKRFRGAYGWLSDDTLRLPLKIESEIFVGSVWVELERYLPPVGQSARLEVGTTGGI